ncbi:hypothetical protein ACI65C_004815 [Semiaphis heraclei]
MDKRLQDPANKTKNQIASRKSMEKRLQDPVNKKKNLIASRKSMDKRLQDPSTEDDDGPINVAKSGISFSEETRRWFSGCNRRLSSYGTALRLTGSKEV